MRSPQPSPAFFLPSTIPAHCLFVNPVALPTGFASKPVCPQPADAGRGPGASRRRGRERQHRTTGRLGVVKGRGRIFRAACGGRRPENLHPFTLDNSMAGAWGGWRRRGSSQQTRTAAPPSATQYTPPPPTPWRSVIRECLRRASAKNSQLLAHPFAALEPVRMSQGPEPGSKRFPTSYHERPHAPATMAFTNTQD